MKKIKIKKKTKINSTTAEKQVKAMWVVFALALLCILLTLFIGKSFATLLDNDVEVKENSDLTYYLNVSYDGVDKNGTQSDTTTVSEIKSGTLFVEDKIPDGLEFTGFVTTADGSIGAVKRSDATACTGKVIDDTNEASVTEGVWNAGNTEYTYHGLHYNATTRTVTFQVKNLKAGCELTVGIKTKTPTVDDPATPQREIRRDFYNFATARERGLTINSNTVHAFMGSEFATLYNVNYAYTGNVPDGAPSAPRTSSYSEGTKVGVASNVEVEGYTFSGWTTTDATVSNNSFTMPGNDVTFIGSFTQNPTKKVTYTLTGTTPDGYVLPSEKEYYPGSIVNLDSLKEGDVFNGYRFLGWTTTDVTVSSDRDFTMPSTNVTLVGEFEEVTYKVTYQFYDGVLPPNAENYLPQERAYKPGVTVTVENVVSEPSGYKFLGWYKESEFEMPEHDVIIYGEWKVQTGTFEPTITKTLISNKTYYRVGDAVEFRITVTNTATFPINNIIVKENTEHSSFKSGTGYTVLSDHVANVDILAANSSIDLYATYTVQVDDSGTITNEAEIKGALASNDYQLVDKEYKATATFKIQSKIKICKAINGSYNENQFQFHITGTTNNYETWVILEKDGCETIFVDPSTYKVKEIVPQEYSIKSVAGAVTSDNANLVVAEGHNYEITYTNEFVKKGFLHSFGNVKNQIVQGGS